jgi:prepilin-type N-terminal cleavage/methylation domain-containing protein
MTERMDDKGFSLIELAIAILLSGAAIAASSQFLIANTIGANTEATVELMDRNQTAIMEFVARQGRYPCPANMSLNNTDAEFGKENCTGIFAANSGLMRTIGRDSDGINGFDNIIIGGIPFTTLNEVNQSTLLPESNTIDKWGRRIVYVVSEMLTDENRYADFYGAISVVDEHGKSLVEPAGSAHALLISLGANGKGAYTQYGDMMDMCGVVGYEAENCDWDGTFMLGLQYETPDLYYDDVVRVIMIKAARHWMHSSNDPTKIYNTNPGFVGMGETNPLEKLHVDGDIRAAEAYITKLCDLNGENCLEPSYVGGSQPSMDCSAAAKNAGPNMALFSLGSSMINPTMGIPQATCANTWAGFQNGTAPFALPYECPNRKEFISAIHSDGTIECSPP